MAMTKPSPNTIVRILPDDSNGNMAAMYLAWYGTVEGPQRQRDAAAHGVEAALLKAEARAKQSAK